MGRIKETVSKIGRILGYTGIATMLSGQPSCSPNEEIRFSDRKRAPQTYAILFAPYDAREQEDNVTHPIDKHCDWISVARVYKELLDHGVKRKNIFVLYMNGDPDFADPAVKDIRDIIKQEFNGDYSNAASEENLRDIEAKITAELGKKDKLILYLTSPNLGGGLYVAQGSQLLTPQELSDMLEDNKGETLVMINTCYGGSFVTNITANGLYISSSDKAVAWADREFSFAQIFFNCLNEVKDEQKGKPGVNYWAEAYKRAKGKYEVEGKKRMAALEKIYPEPLDDVGFDAVIFDTRNIQN